MEFPRDELLRVADETTTSPRRRTLVLRAVWAYDELAERCVMDRTRDSLEIANLRNRLREIDPLFPKDHG